MMLDQADTADAASAPTTSLTTPTLTLFGSMEEREAYDLAMKNSVAQSSAAATTESDEPSTQDVAEWMQRIEELEALHEKMLDMSKAVEKDLRMYAEALDLLMKLTQLRTWLEGVMEAPTLKEVLGVDVNQIERDVAACHTTYEELINHTNFASPTSKRLRRNASGDDAELENPQESIDDAHCELVEEMG